MNPNASTPQLIRAGVWTAAGAALFWGVGLLALSLIAPRPVPVERQKLASSGTCGCGCGGGR